MTDEAGPPDKQHASPVGTWYEDHCPEGESSKLITLKFSWLTVQDLRKKTFQQKITRTFRI